MSVVTQEQRIPCPQRANGCNRKVAMHDETVNCPTSVCSACAMVVLEGLAVVPAAVQAYVQLHEIELIKWYTLRSVALEELKEQNVGYMIRDTFFMASESFDHIPGHWSYSVKVPGTAFADMEVPEGYRFGYVKDGQFHEYPGITYPS